MVGHPRGHRSFGDNVARCEYILRAQRLNVYPDNVELVWFDSIHDTANTALPLYVAINAARRSDLLSMLCAPNNNPATFMRPFVSRSTGFQEVQAFKSPLDCVGNEINDFLGDPFNDTLLAFGVEVLVSLGLVFGN